MSEKCPFSKHINLIQDSVSNMLNYLRDMQNVPDKTTIQMQLYWCIEYIIDNILLRLI